MKKTLALILALVMVLSLAAFASAEENYNPDAIIYTTSTDNPTHLDPVYVSDGQSTTITGKVYSGLIGYNHDGSIFYDVAESVDISEDALTYTFHIRDGIKFHDGTTLDANAVKWNWDRVVPEPVGHGTADMPYSEVLFGNIASYQVIDDLTFEATLKQPDTDTLILLGSNSLAAAIVSPTAYEADPEGFDHNPVGSGPYKFVEWVSGQYVRLERYDDYHLGKPTNGGIICRIIPESATMVSELMTGGIDVLTTLPADQIDMLEAADNVNVVNQPSNNLSYLSFVDIPNTIFNDIRLRQAVCYALDMDSINAALYGDGMDPAMSAIPINMQAGADERYQPIGYDPEKAKELMAEAGYPDGFTFKLLTYNVTKGYNPRGEQLAIQMAVELEKVGITMEVSTKPWAEIIEYWYSWPKDTEGDNHFDATLSGWGADYNTSSNILFLFSAEENEGGNNYSTWYGEKFNEYFQAAKTATSYEEAGEYYYLAAQNLNEEVPVYILGHGVDHIATSTKILNADECYGGWGTHDWQVKKAD